MDLVHPVEGVDAVNIINEWDYPTELGDYELDNANFFEIGDCRGFVWFEQMPSDEGLELIVHLAGNPEMRGSFWSRRAWVEILAWCIQAGAKKLWALRLPDILQEYALRVGFVQDDTVSDWYFINLVDKKA